ncbi:MAG: ABC-F family ATP-binding cassette domain-containing protein [Acidimicrobiales bacterium]
MLSASGLRKAHGTRVLFRDVTITLPLGRRAALVGSNGTGKTTLLEILAGIHPPDAGDVHRPRDLQIGYLPQDLAEAPDGTVLETTMAGAEHLNALAHRIHELEHQMASDDPAIRDRALALYGDEHSRYEQLGGYALEAKAHRVLAGLGFAPGDGERPMRELSGGWRMRVALARLLLAEPDVLLLDEPTNHLDVDSVAWLEGHLQEWPGAILFVSHDRDFIDAIAQRVFELSNETISEYVGGFAEFVALREERLEQQRSAAANQARKVQHVEKFIERFRYKATKARQVQSRVKALERLDRIEVPERRELIARFAFPAPGRCSRVVAELENVDAGYDGEVVLSDVSFVLERGRKVALVGPNGAGKTTLLRMLLGEIQPMAGTITLGANVDPAFFAQHQAEVLDPMATVYQEFAKSASDKGRNLRTTLGAFGFSGDAAERKVLELSGGERTRLALAKVMANPVNLLVLDEPTNHLDLQSCDVLEDALGAYPGTVLLVTHDRYLIRTVADAVIEVRNGYARWHEGVDEELLFGPTAAPPTALAAAAPRRASNAPKPTAASPKPAAATAPRGAKSERKRNEADARNKKHRDTRELKKNVERVEKQWEAAEARVAQLMRQLSEPETYGDGDRVRELAAEYETAKDQAAKLMAEWERAALEVERGAVAARPTP